MTPLYHAISSTHRFGGNWQDYIAVHNWFDNDSKACFHDYRHRALRHHSLGIKECCDHFGDALVNSEGDLVPIKELATQHVMEDCGFIPSLQDWLSCIHPKPWMLKVAKTNKDILAEEKRLAQTEAIEVANKCLASAT